MRLVLYTVRCATRDSYVRVKDKEGSEICVRVQLVSVFCLPQRRVVGVSQLKCGLCTLLSIDLD